MSRQTDHLKFQAWQSRLERHATSGLSVARFCSGERVSVARFHCWRRKCSRPSPKQSAPLTVPAFSPVELLSHRSVTIRFAAGAVMEIPEDRDDLVRTAILAICEDHEPC